MPRGDLGIHAAATVQAPGGEAVDGDAEQSEEDHSGRVRLLGCHQARNRFGQDEHRAGDEDESVEQSGEQ